MNVPGDIETPLPTADPHHSGEGPIQPLSTPATLGYSLANFGYGMFYALNNAVIPLFLQAYTKDARLLGLMGSSHSFEGAVIQPVVGAASDRLRTRWGRRRPFMLIFIPLSALFLVFTPWAGHLPSPHRLAAIIAAIFLFTVFFNIAMDPYQALMPDITPVPQRGRVTGITVLFMVLGQAALTLLHLPISTKFLLTAGIMLATTLLTCAWVREPHLPAYPGKTSRHWEEMKQALHGLRTLKQARKALASLFLSGLGIGAVFPFLTVFVKTITGASDQEAQQMFLILMICTALGVLPFGWLADRIGPKSVLLLGLGMIAGAAVIGYWVQTLTQIGLVLALAGIGNAAQASSSYPLLTEVVPAEEVGFYTGLQTTALSIATPLTAVLTGSLINQGGYRSIFLVCSICLAASFVVMMTLHQRNAVHEVEARKRETGA